jgi:hypothetical protein
MHQRGPVMPFVRSGTDRIERRRPRRDLRSNRMTLPGRLSDNEIEVVTDALIGRPGWYDLARTLESAANQRSSDALRMLSLAFVYDLVAPEQSDRRATAGSPYASMWESPESSYPPRVGDVVNEMRKVWRFVLNTVHDPIVCSRLADLLYVAAGRSAHAEGRRAAACLVELTSEAAWTALDKGECIARAIEIQSELNDRAGLAASTGRCVELIDELLGQEHPGPPFIALRALIALQPKNRPDEIAALLDRVIAHFAGSTHEATALGLAADAAMDPQTKLGFRRRQLAARLKEARNAEGVAKVALLQRAAEFARGNRLSAEAAAILSELQNIPQSELGLDSLEVSQEVPTEAIREEVDRLAGTGANHVFDALRRIGAGVQPPGGSNSDLDAEVNRQAEEFPLSQLFGQTILGPETAAPHFVANDEESKRRVARGRLRRIHAEFVANVFLGPLLHRAAEHHGKPPHDEIAAHFATELIGPQRGERFARALELFWDEDYDASAHVLAPRLESVLRDLARARGITIVKPVSEGNFGGVISLNTVMSKLRAMDPDIVWLDYLEALLCDPLALNLRNHITHGIVPAIGGGGAALLLHAACFLSLLRPGTEQ